MSHIKFHNPELSIREPWWFYLWAIWGGVCAAIVYWVDASLSTSVVWLAAGLVIGRFGEPIWGRMVLAVFGFQSRFFGPNDDCDTSDSDESASLLVWVLNGSLDLVDPNRKPWEIYLGTVVGVGVVHGILVGAVVGSLSPGFGDWPATAFMGALLGIGGGPLIVCLLYAIVLPVFIVVNCRGPSIEGIRATVQAAAEEAEQLEHQFVDPGHLLIAVLRKPSGAVERLLRGRSFDHQRIHDDIVAQLPVTERSGCEESEDDDSSFAVIENAIEQARRLKHRQVEPGHLLLGLLEVRPEMTAEMLATVGLKPGDFRGQIIDYLNQGVG